MLPAATSSSSSASATAAAGEARAVGQHDGACGGAAHGDDNASDDEYEYEIEEMADDEPMQVAHRLFLGSIDAARNESALRRLRIGFSLALLSAADHANGDGIAAAPARLATAANDASQPPDANDMRITRAEISITDSLDEALFAKLPSMLATLQRVLHDAEQVDRNVLVHCVAGRSRSPALVAAWLITQRPHMYARAEDATDAIRDVRPWIALNAHFERELALFHAVTTLPSGNTLEPNALRMLTQRSALGALPRLDFGASLVRAVVTRTKMITMRLLSDRRDDANSDLQAIYAHTTVVATTTAQSEAESAPVPRRPFALLRIDRIETTSVRDLSAADLAKSGAASAAHVLQVLQEFYPHVTTATPLLMLHFACIGCVEARES